MSYTSYAVTCWEGPLVYWSSLWHSFHDSLL